MNSQTAFRRLAIVATALAFGVVLLGAWVRLTDAGLGCPDWPGCYGHLAVPLTADEIATANESWSDRPVETGKAWREMIHRYFAGILGLVVFALAALAWANRRDPDQPVALPLALAVLIVAQALFGMWTVTLLLKPIIVLIHLAGGMATLALLWLLVLRTRAPEPAPVTRGLRIAARAGLFVVCLQILLGGWTSTNYAALACPDLPTCQTRWWPDPDFAGGFDPWHGLGIDYEGGVLDNAARVAIHLAHRIGALVTLLVVGAISVAAIVSARHRLLRGAAVATGVALVAQIAIGIAIVLFQLPLPLAVAHNGTAALLLLATVWLNYAARSPDRHGAPVAARPFAS